MTEPALTGSNKLTRRRVTSAAVVGGATAALVARPTAADAAAPTYTPVAYTRTRLAGPMELHIASRFGYGWTPTLGKEIALAGGWMLWFERQLTGSVDDTFATMQNYKRWCLVRRVHSRKQVLESRISAVTLAGQDGTLGAGRSNSLQTIRGNAGGALGSGARAGLQMVADFGPIRATAEAPANGAVYPDGDLTHALAAAARTIRADIGAEVITRRPRVLGHACRARHARMGRHGQADPGVGRITGGVLHRPRCARQQGDAGDDQ